MHYTLISHASRLKSNSFKERSKLLQAPATDPNYAFHSSIEGTTSTFAVTFINSLHEYS